MSLETNYHAINGFSGYIRARFANEHRDLLEGFESGWTTYQLRLGIGALQRLVDTYTALQTDEHRDLIRDAERELERIEEGSGVHDMKTFETGGGHGARGEPGTATRVSALETAAACLGTYSDREFAGDNPSRSALEARGEWGIGDGLMCDPVEIRYDLDSELDTDTDEERELERQVSCLAIKWARRSGVASDLVELRGWTHGIVRRYRMHGATGWVKR